MRQKMEEMENFSSFYFVISLKVSIFADDN